jgi:hypothetical protein
VYRNKCTAASVPQGCSSVLYFEARKHKDLYLWVAKSPSGPSVKFHVTNGEAGWLGGQAAATRAGGWVGGRRLLVLVAGWVGGGCWCRCFGGCW